MQWEGVRAAVTKASMSSCADGSSVSSSGVKLGNDLRKVDLRGTRDLCWEKEVVGSRT